MKVLITGTKWHYELPQMVAFGFQEVGHQTEIFYDNPPNLFNKASKILNKTPFRNLKNKFDDKCRKEVEEKFLEKIKEFKPDFIFVVGGALFSYKIIKRIRSEYKVPIVNFVIDDPAFYNRTLFYDLSAYTELFVIDRSWMTVLEFFNAGHVHYLPHAGDSSNFKKLDLKKKTDIAFVGSFSLRMPNAPSGYIRAEILNALAEAGLKIKTYAPGITEAFEEFPALKNIEYYDEYKNHEEVNKFYNEAKIVLSIHSPQLKSGVSPRVFDAALSGTFQLVQYEPELDELFPKGIIKSFKNTKELVDLASYYLKHNKECEEIAKKILDWVIKNHQFKNRAKFILKICKI
jgi:spore maturation protein CgeB